MEQKKQFTPDFTVQTASDRPRILQLTDTQIIDSAKQRYQGRLSPEETAFWAPDQLERRLLRYVRGAIARTRPDVIVITGDFVYGEFDDDGANFRRLTDFMDGFGIPWTVCLGNHERDSAIGVRAMCGMLEQSRFCMYRRENHTAQGKPLEGDGTFSVALTHAGATLAILSVMDSGSATERSPMGIFANQRAWLEQQREQEAVKLAFVHIPPRCFDEAAGRYGYRYEQFAPFEIPQNRRGDFGYMGVRVNPLHFMDGDNAFFASAKRAGVRGIFAGHIHEISTSILYEGVRLTYGCKTGEYDSFCARRLGGTLIVIDPSAEQGFTVSHSLEAEGNG